MYIYICFIHYQNYSTMISPTVTDDINSIELIKQGDAAF